MKNFEQKKSLNYKSKDEYKNQLDKIYEINLHGKFTVIVHRSFVRLHIRPTTYINPCYLYDLSSRCDSEMVLHSNLIDNYYLDENRKEKKRKSIHRKMRKLITQYKKSIKENKTSTFIIHAFTTQKQNNYYKIPPVITEQEHSHYGFFVFLFVISIIILGFILWYVFIKLSQSPKSTIRPLSDDCDSDGGNDNDQYCRSSQTNRSVDSLCFDDDNDVNNLERKLSDNMTFNNIRNHHEMINHKNLQILIQNLQQSDFESIDSSTIGEILSDLIQHEVNVANVNPNLEPSTDLLKFLSNTSEIFRIIRTIITKKYSCQSLNPTYFLQYQYLIDILHSSEFILEYLHQYYSHEKIFLIEILTHLYQILSLMNNNSSKCQYICQYLFDILQKLNRKQSSYS
ncbi:unnamed protein product [Rotaria sordida]|uniref:Uncharacterized protein n=1 Tax=Rotaria sordida TaxID=392033 RepID=A0A813XC77_9BILA|nr:unnamed protein product [Rotaria sordida]